VDLSLPEPDRAGFVEVNRTRLRVWEWGEEDAPVVVCIHGAYDHGRMWDGLAPRLAAAGYRVVAPDVRGHGDSGRLSSGHLWAVSAIDLGLLARELGPPVGLIGHSFGGGQALYVAACWPELVRWVVNLDGLGPPAEAFEERDMVEGITKSLRTLARLRSRPPRVYESLDDMQQRRQQVNVRLPAEWVAHLVRHGAVETEGGYAWKADPMFSVGFPGDFGIDHLHAEHALVTGPVLVLTGGEKDTWSELSDEELADRLRHLPDVRHEVVADAGHYVHIEQPDVVLDAIERFVAEVGR
jgi:pimeloyl-ACP methyl ester carboxylesterase